MAKRSEVIGASIIGAVLVAGLAAFVVPGNALGAAKPSASSPASGAGATAKVVRIGYFGNLTHAPALIAKQQQLFRKYLPGATIQFTTFTVGTAEIEALKGGALDIGYVGPGPAISGYATTQGQLLNIVGGSTYGGASLIVKPGLIAKAGKPTSAEIAALSGKTIADPGLGGTQDIALKSYLKSNGFCVFSFCTMNAKKANVTGMANADTLALFEQGKLDGAWVPEPWATRLVNEGGGKTFVDEASLWPNGKFATTVIVAAKKFAQKYPGSVRGLLQANEDAIAFLNKASNRPAAIDQVQRELQAATGKRLLPDIIRQAWPRLGYSSDPIIASVKQNFVEAGQLGFLPYKNVDALKGIFDLTQLNAVRQSSGLKPISVPADLQN